MESKATRYIVDTQGDIATVLILEVHHPRADSASVSLIVADGVQARWVQRGEIFYSDQLVDQPEGQVGFYVSDFLRGSIPQELRRPSATELAAGLSRSVPFLPIFLACLCVSG